MNVNLSQNVVPVVQITNLNSIMTNSSISHDGMSYEMINCEK